jgi:hypothetical protein
MDSGQANSWLIIMALNFRCIIKTCKKQIVRPGGLIFGPPDENDKSEKAHICEDCYEKLKKTLFYKPLFKK